MKHRIFLMTALLLGVAPAWAGSLDDLLKQVQESSQAAAKVDQERELRFLRNKNEQAALLQKAQSEFAAAQARANSIKARFEAGQKEIADLKGRLQARAGDYAQLYGSARETAGTFRAFAAHSLITAQYPDRLQLLERIAKDPALPSLSQLEQLWFTLQQEMTETGKSARFPAEIVDGQGGHRQAEVTRVGAFTAFADGEYLVIPKDATGLRALPHQPGNGARDLAQDFAETPKGLAPIVVDASRGTLLALEAERPSLSERVEQGGFVGYVIIAIGVLGAGLGLYQFVFLTVVGERVRLQLQNTADPRQDNPLGRVLASFKAERGDDPEVLEMHLSEAVLRETPRLERFQNLLRMIIAAGPLLGLLGTVGGMIITFQVITEVGAGDPKVMAGGISQAMVSTVLGLGIAIPLLFVNAFLIARSKMLVQILDEQSAGLLAQRMEVIRGWR